MWALGSNHNRLHGIHWLSSIESTCLQVADQLVGLLLNSKLDLGPPETQISQGTKHERPLTLAQSARRGCNVATGRELETRMRQLDAISVGGQVGQFDGGAFEVEISS